MEVAKVVGTVAETGSCWNQENSWMPRVQQGIQIPMASPGRKGTHHPCPELVLLSIRLGCSRHLSVSARPSGWWNCGWDVRLTVNYDLSTDAGRQQS